MLIGCLIIVVFVNIGRTWFNNTSDIDVSFVSSVCFAVYRCFKIFFIINQKEYNVQANVMIVQARYVTVYFSHVVGWVFIQRYHLGCRASLNANILLF